MVTLTHQTVTAFHTIGSSKCCCPWTSPSRHRHFQYNLPDKDMAIPRYLGLLWAWDNVKCAFTILKETQMHLAVVTLIRLLHQHCPHTLLR